MKTYLLYDGRLYKIGQTNNINQRIKNIYTANPFIKMLGSTDKISEKTLHDIYKNYRVKLEWFDLNDSQVEDILDSFKTGRHTNRTSLFPYRNSKFFRLFLGINYDSIQIKTDIQNEINIALKENKQWTLD